MVLDDSDRGMLERNIDKGIKEIAGWVRTIFNPDAKSGMHIQNEFDFVYGMTYQGIMRDFFHDYCDKYQYQRVPTKEEIQEVVQIIYRRTSEIRNAIQTSGIKP
jgi:hypothetical protein